MEPGAAIGALYGFGTFLVLAIAVLLLRSFLPAYAGEKGRNLATKEDIAAITDEVERVKSSYANELTQLQHQNERLLEELRGRQQLQMAAVEKRLEVHQDAFTRWRVLLLKAHSGDVAGVVQDCQQWWDRRRARTLTSPHEARRPHQQGGVPAVGATGSR